MSVSGLFSSVLRVCKARKILGVFEVFLGIFKKTKEKKDRVQTVENKGESDRFWRDFGEFREILELPPAKRPLS